MVTLRDLLVAVRGTLAEWQRLPWNAVHYPEARNATLVLVVLLAASLLMLLGRGLRTRKIDRTHVALPALLPPVRRSRLSGSRHAAFAIFVLGVPFFALALADPHTTFTREEVSFPGRRIALLVDASTSMTMKFESAKLRAQATPVFFTAVAAAEHFVRLRMKGPYHDLLSLIEFGNEAYVVTPFTTDYENILLSLKLIGDPREWGRFNDYGTTILQSLNVGTQLFKAFDFVNASGNLMVVFTDGRDDQASLKGRQMDDVVAEARQYGIPVYMIRTAFNMDLGRVQQDKLWKEAVEKTGGRFYAAPNEEAILRAETEINQLSAGRIDRREYTSQRPRYAGFALIAVAFWITAGMLKLGFRRFRTFP